MRTPTLLATALVAASTIALATPTGTAAADPPPTPVAGAACAPGSGVTVVVDLSPFDGPVELGCALGSQAHGLDALANAGFTATDESGAGTVCTIDGHPAAGYPYCWLTGGYWSYWRAAAGEPWGFSETGAGGTGTIPVDSIEGWIFHTGFSGDTPACGTSPDAPVLTIIADDETLPFSTVDGTGVEIAVLDPATTPVTEAVFALADELDLAPYTDRTIRVLARRAAAAAWDGPQLCSDLLLFDATYDVGDTYAPRAGTGWNPAPATVNNPDVVRWATGAEDLVLGAQSTNPSFHDPANATGPSNGTLVVLGDRGRITLTFDTPFGDLPGYDFVLVENGFASGAADYLELAYVEVSSNGVDFARFDTASRQPTPVGSFATQPAELLGGMGGRDITTGLRYGTPFDLTALRNDSAVRSGGVDLDAITHVRIVDITGDGDDLDSFGRPIYDPHPNTATSGFDLDAVGVYGPTRATIEWLEAELGANGGSLPSPYDPASVDWGLTLDAVLALNRGGRGAAAPATTALGLLEASVADYITGESFGDAGSLYAGALGKTLLSASLQGADVNGFGGRDLEVLSRGAMLTSGLHAGRFADVSAWGDYSNVFGQTLNMLGLSHTAAGIPGAAVSFLLDQQCPGGGFRLFFGDVDNAATTRGCVDDAAADPDSTALSVQALLAAEPGPSVSAAVAAAEAWLLDVQHDDGAFGGSGPTSASNSNSTGLVGQALWALGSPAAVGAEDYVRNVRLDAAETAGTPAAGEEGVIAYNLAAHDDALVNGIAPLTRDQWRRATAQAILALQFPAFGAPAPAPVAPDVAFGTVPADPSGPDVEFTFTSSDTAATFECALDGATASPCASPFGLSGLAEGEHTLAVNAVDPSGNSSTVVTHTWDVDVTGPVVAIDADVVAVTSSTSVSFSVSSDDAGALLECRLDGGAWAGCGDPQVYSGLAGGGHTFRARGIDVLGNVGPVATFKWTIVAPATPPAVTPVTSARVADTRPGRPVVDGGLVGSGSLEPGEVLVVPVAGLAGVATDAAAAVLNVTVVGASGAGHATVWDCSQPRPVASSVNFLAGGAFPNAVISGLS
ncbi:MAG TPA: hypothetical protein VNQ73_07715, partial [Ilumatobacter sp.]|nr:hypothetical protein [Ilumatobacter sp.]